MTSRRAFYFREQGGVCALTLTDACRRRGGTMRDEKPKSGRQPKDIASWDHVWPRGQREDGDEPLQLLACVGCNNARGDTPPDPLYVARAQALRAGWLNVQETENAPKGRQRRKMERRVKRRFGRSARGPGPTRMDQALFEAMVERRPMSALSKRTLARQRVAKAKWVSGEVDKAGEAGYGHTPKA